MRILLDTHIFLWFITGHGHLTADVQRAIRNPNNLTIATVDPAMALRAVRSMIMAYPIQVL